MGRRCCRYLYAEVTRLKGVMGVAVLVVVDMLTLLAAAFILNAIGIVSGRFDYPFDPAIVGLCQIVLSAAVSVLALGRYVEEEEEQEKEEVKCLPAPVTDAEIVIESEQLDNLFPGVWDGEITIREDKVDDQK